ncbi:MAG: DUF423 domain-containing protein [Crocinitomicaceae bacterium]|nr:DUF423 domain-containing protein [Crocinitomicaceae bacterium]
MNFIRISFFLLLLAVVTGAFGAHTIGPLLSPEHYAAYRTGVEYHFLHAIGILLVSLLASNGWLKEERLATIQWLLFLGVICFSGSIYLLSTRDISGWEGVRFLGPVTPLGGTMFIAAWALAVFSVKRKDKKN